MDWNYQSHIHPFVSRSLCGAGAVATAEVAAGAASGPLTRSAPVYFMSGVLLPTRSKSPALTMGSG